MKWTIVPLYLKSFIEYFRSGGSDRLIRSIVKDYKYYALFQVSDLLAPFIPSSDIPTNNEVFKTAPLHIEAFEAVPVKSQDQGVDSLEEQLVELNQYESLKLPAESGYLLPEPQHVSQLPPIDSDLISSPNEALGHPILSSYSLTGQFVRPKANKYPIYSSTTSAPSSSGYVNIEQQHDEIPNEHYFEAVPPKQQLQQHYEELPVVANAHYDAEPVPIPSEQYIQQPEVHSDLFYTTAPLHEHHSEPVVLSETHYEQPSSEIYELSEKPVPPTTEYYEKPVPSTEYYENQVQSTPEPSSEYYYKPAPPSEHYNYPTPAPYNEQYNTIHHVVPTPKATSTTSKPPITKPFAPSEVYYKPYPNTFKPEPEIIKYEKTPKTTKAPNVIYKEIKPYKQHHHKPFDPFGIFGSQEDDQYGSPSYTNPSEPYDPKPKPSVIFKGKNL